MVERRRFISGFLTAGTVTIAGCTGGDISDSSGGLQNDQSGPEAAVEQFATAVLVNGNPTVANEVVHPESPDRPIEQADVSSSSDITVSDLRQISPQTVVELNAEASGGASDEEIQRSVSTLNEEITSLVDNAGAEDHAFVIVTVDEDGDQAQNLISVVQDNGDWLIYHAPSRIASAPHSVGEQQAQTQAEQERETDQGLRISDVAGSATDDGAIDSIEIKLLLKADSEPVNVENATFIIESENSRAEISGERSTSGVEYRSGQSLSDGETTLREQDDLLIAELDLTETSVSNFEANQQPTVTIELPDGTVSETGLNIPNRVEGGSSYIL